MKFSDIKSDLLANSPKKNTRNVDNFQVSINKRNNETIRTEYLGNDDKQTFSMRP